MGIDVIGELSHRCERPSANEEAATNENSSPVRGEWSDDDGTRLRSDATDRVRAAAKEAESAGTLLDEHLQSPKSIFEDVFETMPPHLVEQQRQLESGL